MRVNSLDGTLLDFWVAKSENLKLSPDAPEVEKTHVIGSGYWHPSTYHPSSDWSQAGEIISNEWYCIEDALIEWFGTSWPYIKAIQESPLKWLMRAYVKTKFGEVVEDVENTSPITFDSNKSRHLPEMKTGRKFLPRFFGKDRPDMKKNF